MGLDHIRITLKSSIGKYQFSICSSFTDYSEIHQENRLCGQPIEGCNISVDGTDCPVYENHPFDRSLFSHKFKRAGLRYEIAVCIHSGEIVWCHGPFKCGSYPDLRIFRLRLKNLLIESNEKAIADRGYRDEVCVTPDSNPRNEQLSRIRARGEAANGRLKNFFVLSHCFRHDLSKHSTCFYAVLSMFQLLSIDMPLFDM